MVIFKKISIWIESKQRFLDVDLGRFLPSREVSI